jgi:Transcription factor WhiB
MSAGGRVLLVAPVLPDSYELLRSLINFLSDDGYLVPCRGTSQYRWHSESRADERAASAACLSCPAVLVCNAYATEADEWGVWGGRTRKQRLEGKYPPMLLQLMQMRSPIAV